MEEVDQIILQSLRDIGCAVEDDAKLQTLSPEDIYKCIGILCKCIRPDVEIPGHLPAQMAQRFGAASQLVDCCKSLGFKGDLGYQTILYSNHAELRLILMWLIEHIPKSEDKVDSFRKAGDVSKAKTLEDSILRQLSVDLKRPWICSFLQRPQNFKSEAIEELETPDMNHNMTEDLLEYKRRFEPSIFHQTRNLMPSIISTHDKNLTRKESTSGASGISSETLRSTLTRSIPSLTTLTSSPSIPSRLLDVSEKAEGDESSGPQKPPQKPKTRFEILAERIDELKANIEDQENVYRNLIAERKQDHKSIEDETQRLEDLKKKKKLNMQIAMLLDDPEESKEKLERSLEVATNRKEKLNAKFQAHKEPLEVTLESFSGTNSIKLAKSEEKTANIKDVRNKIQEFQEDVRIKTETQLQLKSELSEMKRVTERSAYTSRILDIVNSIKKQNNGINEVLKDTKSLQKSINSLEGQLQRQFLASEDLIWNNTNKKDEFSKKSYKLLISLHTQFSELIDLIESTGSFQREVRELEDQIDNERQQNVKQKLEQITKDLEMIVSCN